MIARLIRTMPSSRRRVAGIEGVRASRRQASSYHAWLYSEPDGVPAGNGTFVSVPFESLSLWVTLFFVLSGFLLYAPFAAAALERQRRVSVSAYFFTWRDGRGSRFRDALNNLGASTPN